VVIPLSVAGCGGGLSENGEGAGGAAGEAPWPWVGGDCSPDVTECLGNGCPPAVTGIDHAAWLNRLTESPEITWQTESGAYDRVQIAFGTAPGEMDVWCWEDVADGTFTARALWLDHGVTYFANVRTVAGREASATRSSAGWTTDVVGPEAVAWVSDQLATVEAEVTWSDTRVDDLSGFDHFEVALGSFPGATDVMGWTPSSTTSAAFDMADAPEGQWAYAEVRTVDLAGNASAETLAPGFIRCPEAYVFVPPDETEGIETDGFCVAKYEMRPEGYDDGMNLGFVADVLPQSRMDGRPWSGLDRMGAVAACTLGGMQYTLLSNIRWQAIARNLENNPGNWSGQAVGSGLVNRGHHDEDPYDTLAASTDDDPCFGTGSAGFADAQTADWDAKRTHVLDDGEVIWDFVGNAMEHVDGSIGFGDGGLWTSFDDAVFTSAEGWEENRVNFGPEGPYTYEQGMGMIYGGEGNLLRGGAYTGYDYGTGGSMGADDAGLYHGHHSMWWLDDTQGFRCAYQP
jgi:hypothetical protein